MKRIIITNDKNIGELVKLRVQILKSMAKMNGNHIRI